MAGEVAGWQSYFGAIASSKTFWYARARSFSTGKLSLPHGTVSLLTGRARGVPSQIPSRFGVCASDVAGACAAAAPPSNAASAAAQAAERDQCAARKVM